MLRLIGIPHAGGSAASLAPLRRHFAHALEFRACELPGRGVRHTERLHTERPALIEQLCTELMPELHRPYALFGHSLGGLLAYELAHALIARGARAPSMLFIAAAPGPHTWTKRHNPRTRMADMPDTQLIELLKERGGTPAEVFDHPELVELFMPVVRADFTLCEAPPARDLQPLPCAVHVSAGLRDAVSIEELADWRRTTQREFSLSWFDGDHFFVRSHAARLCAAILQRLAEGDLVASSSVSHHLAG